MDEIAGDPAAADEPVDDEQWLHCTDAELGRGLPLTAAELVARRCRQREARERWRYLPDDDLPEPPAVEPAGLGPLLRAMRSRARLSQRELATASGVALASITGVEAGEAADVGRHLPPHLRSFWAGSQHRTRQEQPRRATGPLRATMGRPRGPRRRPAGVG